MAQDHVPPRPPKSFRIVLVLDHKERRLDNILLKHIREQKENMKLKIISRVEYKELFDNGKILIKGQRARPSSAIAAGTTYVDILGY
jgi:hypothetical protein